MSSRASQIAIVGAGIGGLAAAVDLAARGHRVIVLERAAAPGGKMRQVMVGDAAIDAGPTVFTMRWVFEELFAAAGAALSDHLTLTPADVLARHAWNGHERLDLFADVAKSADAIGRLSGAGEARGFLAFCARSRRIYQTLERPFIRAPLPTTLSLVRAAGLRDMLRIAPFASLWQALGEHFHDPRLRQLFGRYATYAGSSPFLAPATLMLIAHVEREGVWLVAGGMHRLAVALAKLAAAHAAELRYGAHVAGIELAGGHVAGVRLADGERIAADAVVLNADVAALATGRFGAEVAGAVPAAPATRSLSAVTWAMTARTDGFALSRHNVFFGPDYAREFDDQFARQRLSGQSTVYVCAQDRDAGGHAPHPGAERLFCLVNAPAVGDARPFGSEEIAQCTEQMLGRLRHCGLTLHRSEAPMVVTTPAEFERLFPATGGALYGPAVHGAMASFRRPGARSRMPGLYLAGGSTHPGAGVPMAALSGRLAAASLHADLASTARLHPMATRGGTSTRSATTAATPSP
jgi:1-hydroxycarotenoid 3,4-desaturase